MNDPKLDLLIKEKKQKYVPARPVQVMHCGAIVLTSIAIGILSLPGGQEASTTEKLLGVSLAVTGLILYAAWTVLRIDKARKEAHAEYLQSQNNRKTGKRRSA